MGDTDDSSNAAQSALPRTEEEQDQNGKAGFFGRILEALTPAEELGEQAANGQMIPAPQTHGMINLRRMRVEDVAIPSADVISVPSTIDREELVKVFRESGMTRIPVYDGTLDTPLGFVHLKDFALIHGFNGGGADFDLEKMLRPLLFVPPSMPIGVLLAKMQTGRRHMALVIDEYGGVDGLATIEDLIEQVVGEIEDEHDIDEAESWVEEMPGCYVALAKTPLTDFETEIGRSLTAHEEIDEEEIDTLGGLVFMLAGHIPTRGELVCHPDGVEFEVMEADPRRIKRLRVRVPKDAA